MIKGHFFKLHEKTIKIDVFADSVDFEKRSYAA